uniref:Apolipoprotein D n=1 Tax=Cacopsylla melanoneura TaxID=428564 RepID=A0A8D9EN46_9HEMI
MAFSFPFILGLFLLVLVHFTHQWNVGRCPTKHYVLSFRPHKWHGSWYEYMRKEAPVWESYSKCNLFNFGEQNSNLLSISFPLSKTKLNVTIETESISGNERDAHYNWKFKFPLFTSEREVYILSTNYYDYALVWSCESYFFFNYQLSWILTREKVPERPWVLKAIQKSLDLAELDAKDFEKVSHDNCNEQ